MHVIRHDPSEPPLTTAPIFTGEVHSRTLVDKEQTEQLRIGLVEFAAGGRNVLHMHTFDQVLYVTKGEGIVATESEEFIVHAGDVAVIPAGEKHWHGATPTTAMSHLAIGQHGTTTVVGSA
jgi:quercetin dioxygenase-like cupin family protein